MEMTSLREIKGKLDALREDMDKLLQSHAALDAKIMATGNGLADELKRIDAGLHETAMRNHVQILEYLKAVKLCRAKPKRKKVRR